MIHIDYPTTYSYAPLPSPNHIRLLHFRNIDYNDGTLPSFNIVVKRLPTKDDWFDFETVSYTWGAPKRVASLVVNESAGAIGLTLHLTEALPHLVGNSVTGYLWIDQ